MRAMRMTADGRRRLGVISIDLDDFFARRQAMWIGGDGIK